MAGVTSTPAVSTPAAPLRNSSPTPEAPSRTPGSGQKGIIASLSAIDGAQSTSIALNAVEAGLQATLDSAVETIEGLAAGNTRRVGKGADVDVVSPGKALVPVTSHPPSLLSAPAATGSIPLLSSTQSAPAAVSSSGWLAKYGKGVSRPQPQEPVAIADVHATSVPTLTQAVSAMAPSPSSVVAAAVVAASAAASQAATADYFIPLPAVTPEAFNGGGARPTPVELPGGNSGIGLKHVLSAPLLTSQVNIQNG